MHAIYTRSALANTAFGPELLAGEENLSEVSISFCEILMMQVLAFAQLYGCGSQLLDLRIFEKMQHV